MNIRERRVYQRDKVNFYCVLELIICLVQAQKAFNILLEKGSQSVSKPYFLEIVKACSLLPSAHDTIIADVFGQLDHDKNGEISLNDFATLLSIENPQANHAQLLASILAKEPEIMKYKALKARREHEGIDLN